MTLTLTNLSPPANIRSRPFAFWRDPDLIAVTVFAVVGLLVTSLVLVLLSQSSPDITTTLGDILNYL